MSVAFSSIIVVVVVETALYGKENLLVVLKRPSRFPEAGDMRSEMGQGHGDPRGQDV